MRSTARDYGLRDLTEIKNNGVYDVSRGGFEEERAVLRTWRLLQIQFWFYCGETWRDLIKISCPFTKNGFFTSAGRGRRRINSEINERSVLSEKLQKNIRNECAAEKKPPTQHAAD